MPTGTKLRCAFDMLSGPQRTPKVEIQKSTTSCQHEHVLMQMLLNVMGSRMTKQYMFLANTLLGIEISCMCFASSNTNNAKLSSMYLDESC